MFDCIDCRVTKGSANLITLNYSDGKYYCEYEGKRVFSMDNREGNKERAMKWLEHFYVKHEYD
jgi:hypothetical protein